MADRSIDRGGAAAASVTAPAQAHERKDVPLQLVSQNQINPLPFPPVGDVTFLVNGHEVDGITNAGTVVTVDPVILTHNIAPPHDRVRAIFDTPV